MTIALLALAAVFVFYADYAVTWRDKVLFTSVSCVLASMALVAWLLKGWL